MIRVVVVDDEPMVCAHLRTILGSAPDIEVVDEAHDGAAGVEAVVRSRPDVVLMDLRMPVLDGIGAIERIVKLGNPPVVVVLTTFDADEYVYQALHAGASGFMLKDAPPDQLLAAIRAAAAGDALIDASITRRFIAQFARSIHPTAAVPTSLATLTARELEVLRQLSRGLSNTEIATELIVEETTVKTHVSRILAKLELRDRVQAVIVAYESGFVQPNA